jgi:hypothetical protein
MRETQKWPEEHWQTWEERKRFWRKEVDWIRVRATAWDRQRQKALGKPSAHTSRRGSTKWSEVLTFFGWFHWIRMRQHSWHACFRHSSSITQIIPSLVMLHLSWSEVGCCLDLWNVTVLQTFKGFYASKMCLYFIKAFRTLLCAIYSSYAYSISSSNQIGILHWKLILIFVTVLQVPVAPHHRDNESVGFHFM